MSDVEIVNSEKVEGKFYEDEEFEGLKVVVSQAEGENVKDAG